jgi:hypothetical protein
MLFQARREGTRIHILILFEMSLRALQNAKVSSLHIRVLAPIP